MSKDQADIRALIESIHNSRHNKDAAAVVGPCAPEATVFNLAPPLSHRGMDLQETQAWLDTWDGPIDCESRDLSITVNGDLAFCHGFPGFAEPRRGPASRLISGCAQRSACIAPGAPGGSSTSTPPYPFIWMAACGPPSTSSQIRGRRVGHDKHQNELRSEA